MRTVISIGASPIREETLACQSESTFRTAITLSREMKAFADLPAPSTFRA
jgi:hypothetical protein